MTTTRYCIYRIASTPDAVDPDRTAALLATCDTYAAAHAQARQIKRAHPEWWIQAQDEECREQGRDIPND